MDVGLGVGGNECPGVCGLDVEDEPFGGIDFDTCIDFGVGGKKGDVFGGVEEDILDG
jgi:hypothetical protein